MNTEWDWTELARFYDKRADYSADAIDALLAVVCPSAEAVVADVGAGTGKLTKLLLARGLPVNAVEPNDAMRSFGIKNTAGGRVLWTEGVGERTGLPPQKYELVTFGSSFNVTDRQKALVETARILRDEGWFACMWNHRDSNDPIQREVDAVIESHVAGYGYNTRLEDPCEVIQHSGLFGQVQQASGRIVFSMSKGDYVHAWRSHTALERQAGAGFPRVIAAIEKRLSGVETLNVPYHTQIWFAQLKQR